VLAALPRAIREAVAEARPARFAFGAVLVDVESGATVFRAHNTTEGGDPSAHAEVNVMRGAGGASSWGIGRSAHGPSARVWLDTRQTGGHGTMAKRSL
jgi:tRNA(Arg) A34 adenosine deaminase TadA